MFDPAELAKQRKENILKQLDLHECIAVDPKYVNAALITAYNTSVRCYHTLSHALNVATAARRLMLIEDGQMDYERIMDVYLAGLWHDAVYETGRQDNEFSSAYMFSLHYPDRKNVARLITRTTIADHLSNDEVDIQLACLLDADLLSLSNKFELFMRNNRNINLELGTTPEMGSSFLMKFLDKKSIYRTGYMKKHYEQIARENITAYYKMFHHD
jgi:predicted metal-dependent HD superfamily phosphohydrolase